MWLKIYLFQPEPGATPTNRVHRAGILSLKEIFSHHGSGKKLMKPKSAATLSSNATNCNQLQPLQSYNLHVAPTWLDSHPDGVYPLVWYGYNPWNKKNAPELIHSRKLTGQQRHFFPTAFWRKHRWNRYTNYSLAWPWLCWFWQCYRHRLNNLRPPCY